MNVSPPGLGWMAGHWRCDIWGGQFEETWSPPCQDGLQGHGRHTIDGHVRFIEFMSIEPADGGLTMFLVLGALAKGTKEPAAFRLKRAGEGEAVFERDGDDYPSRIIYRRSGDRLFCRLDGTVDGQPQVDEFHFRPV